MLETTIGEIGVRSPQTIVPETPVTEAAERLRTAEAAALPVLEAEAVVGIITESDIVALVAETDGRPTVREIMSTPVTTISPAVTLSEAAETMRTTGVKHLPIVSDGIYRGLLSADRLAPYLSRHKLEIEWEDVPLRVDSVNGRKLTTSD